MDRGLDWDEVDLVVFDVDGTLYDQGQVRMGMALDLLKSLDVAAAATIFAFRRTREKLGETNDPLFLSRQFELVASKLHMPVERIRSTITEWIEERPLTHIAQAVVPGAREIFSSLSASGRRIAVFSDYPALHKLAALGLRADLVVSSTDDDVARLKPNPAGLRKILDATGVPARRALMVGDRADRDGAAATSMKVKCLLRTKRGGSSFTTFRTFRDDLFLPVLRASAAPATTLMFQ